MGLYIFAHNTGLTKLRKWWRNRKSKNKNTVASDKKEKKVEKDPMKDDSSSNSSESESCEGDHYDKEPSIGDFVKHMDKVNLVFLSIMKLK